MKRRDFLQVAAATAWAAAALPAASAFAAAPRRKVLFFTKSAGFQHSAIARKEGDDLGFAEKTLTDPEVNAAHDKVVADLKQKFQATVRE